MNFLPRGLGLALVFACTAGSIRAECVSIDAIDVPVTQDFDTLSASGTTNALALPGWYLRETGSSPRANDQYAADTGFGTVGDTLSLGTEGSPDRALGSLRDGNFNPGFGACYLNNTGLPISGLDVGGSVPGAGGLSRKASRASSALTDCERTDGIGRGPRAGQARHRASGSAMPCTARTAIR